MYEDIIQKEVHVQYRAKKKAKQLLSSCAFYAVKLRRKYCSLCTEHAQRNRTCAREY